MFEQRNTLHAAIRSFFASRGYLEVETPILVASPDMSPTLTPFETTLLEVNGTPHKGGLITSPEFSMKKLLGAGLQKIFTLTKVFRNSDFYTDDTPKQHNPEFTMIEWYQQGADYNLGMDETEALIKHCATEFPESSLQFPFARVHIPTAFKAASGVELDGATTDELQAGCERLGLNTDPSDTWSDLFHRIFLTHIETKLPSTGAFVYDFPKEQAALSRLTDRGNPWTFCSYRRTFYCRRTDT